MSGKKCSRRENQGGRRLGGTRPPAAAARERRGGEMSSRGSTTTLGSARRSESESSVGSRHAKSGRRQSGCRCLADMDSSDGRALAMEGGCVGRRGSGRRRMMGNVGSVGRRELADSSIGRRTRRRTWTQVGSRVDGTGTCQQKRIVRRNCANPLSPPISHRIGLCRVRGSAACQLAPRGHMWLFWSAGCRAVATCCQSSLDSLPCGKGQAF